MTRAAKRGQDSVKISRAVGGVSLSAANGIASLIAGIVLLPFILGEVGAASYGVWLILSSVASYLYYSDIGVGAAISHFGSRARGGQAGPSLSSLLASGLVWSGIACLLVAPLYFVFSNWYVSSWGGSIDNAEKTPLVVISLVLLVPLLLRPFSSALIGAGFLTIERRNQLIGVLVRVVGTLVVCVGGFGILGIAIVELSALLIPSFLALASLKVRKLIKFSRSDVSASTLRLMLGFSYKSFSVSMVGTMILQSGMLVIGLVGSSADVTYYNAAFRIYSSVRQLLTWTIDPFRPALSRIYAKRREEGVSVLTSILVLSWGAGAAASVGLIIAVPDLVTLWLGDAVPGDLVSLTAQVLLCGLLVNMIHIPMAPATDAAGKPGALIRGQVLWLVLCIILSVPLASKFGILGIALALSLPLIIVEPLMLRLSLVALEIKLVNWYSSVAKPVLGLLLLPLLAIALISWPVHKAGFDYSWLILGCMFGVFFALAVLALNKKYNFRKLVGVLNVDL